ncbi:hypothetical protein ACFXCP_37725, partial [Streptomyces sp. NPDC059402]
VKPERLTNNRKVYRDYWWQYAEKRPAMLKAISGLERILVVARVSKTGLPAFVPTGQVVSEATVVFASDRNEDLAWLNSSIHYLWAITRGSSLKGDLRYTPSDIYETIPRPSSTSKLAIAGAELDQTRRSIMLHRKIGLTKLYNLVHDSCVNDRDVAELRAIHANVDRAVIDAYGWQDINERHTFTANRQGQRFGLPVKVQTEIIDRLLELNHTQHTGEASNLLF